MRARGVEAHELNVDQAPEVREQLEGLEGDPAPLSEVGDREEDADDQAPSSRAFMRIDRWQRR
jgi:hypothetical protein